MLYILIYVHVSLAMYSSECALLTCLPVLVSTTNSQDICIYTRVHIML